MKWPLLFSLFLSATVSAHPGHAEPHPEPKPQKPVVIGVLYSDFDCRPCAEVSGLMQRIITEKEQPIQMLFKHAPRSPKSWVAHEASLAAAQQGKFWPMHDLLFKNPNANYSDLLKMAESLKLDVKRFQTGLDERLFRPRVISEVTEAKGLGVTVTPTLFLNGQKLQGIDQIRAFVETVLNPPRPKTPDPDRVYEFDLTGSPTTGPENALVTIVEFSDFRCHFCGRHSKAVTELIAAYPGKIRRVFKHFPLQVNEVGKLPHLGAMAAHRQGKFWEMYKVLMSRPLSGPDDLNSRALALGLNMERFNADLTAIDGQRIVQRDVDEGDRMGILSTPTTFFNGRALSGSQTLATLKRHVEAILHPNTAKQEVVPEPVAREEAPVQIEFFANLADPMSAENYVTLTKFRKGRSEVEVHFMHYLPDRATANLPLHRAVIAAGQQGKLWEMCGLIFESHKPVTEGHLLDLASRLGLDAQQFSADYKNKNLLHDVADQTARGVQLGLKGKPAIFLNGKRIDGKPTIAALVKMSEECCSKERPQAKALGADIFTQ